MEEKKRQPCEVYSRIVGYMRPISQWNEGKRAEWEERKVTHLNED
jgi:ribonucleoside-triphosphate reductase (formate)